MIGKRISRYNILEKLGKGGMGEVFLAEDTELKRKVALKFTTYQPTDEEVKTRFKREAQAAAALNHPNIITVYEVGEHEDQSFIVMEYVQGRSLRDWIDSNELTVDQTTDIILQLCNGLGKAHQAGIVHRDLKPSNIMIDGDGQVKILDFGLAKLKDADKLTQTGTTVGTVQYMSPEQFQMEDIDHRSDIWSVGVMLYEMLTGQVPFSGNYQAAIMYSVIHSEPVKLREVKKDIPAPLQSIIDKALTKDKNNRYQRIVDLTADLRKLPKLSPFDTPILPEKKMWYHRSIAWIGVGLLLTLALLFVLTRNKSNIYINNPSADVMADTSRWKNSIAVLPFQNISSDPEQEYFCDGMTEQIITNLSQLQNLKVIARTSAMKFKNTEKTVPEIATELGVATILEGSIRKAGNRIRITAQLIQADEGHHLWANDYDRVLEDIFVVQDDVSQAIAQALIPRLTIDEVDRLAVKRPGNVDAYEYYLQGEYYHLQKFYSDSKIKNFKISESMFNRAIELDSNFADAYAGLADLYNSYTFQVKDEQEYVERQQNLIETAFRLDPNSTRVLRAKAAVHEYVKETQAAYESRKRALGLNPNEASNNHAMGHFLASNGLHHQAIKYFTRAVELDPLYVNGHQRLAGEYRRHGDFDRAFIYYKKALEIEPDNFSSLTYYARFLISMKKYDEAENLMVICEQVNPGYPLNNMNLAMLLASRGEKEESLQALGQSGTLNNRFNKIIIYALLNLKDEAAKLIDNKPFATPWNIVGSDYLEMKNNPVFDNIRNTDDFIVALQKAKETYEAQLIKYEEVFL